MLDERLAVSRRRFLALAGAGVASLALPRFARAATARASDDTGVLSFTSRPDLNPPLVEVTTSLPSAAPGFIFLAPTSGPSQLGPLIIDDTGAPVWFHPLPPNSDKAVHNFRVQTFRGHPVLTWWEGQYANGYGQGEYVIFDSSYREIARFGAANGYFGDLHEFTITSRDTALISAYNSLSADLRPYGGASDGSLLEGVIQEIDIRTGAPLFEWHSADHVTVDESYVPVTAGIWDYFHLNSVDLLDDNNFLISARHTSAIYKLDRDSGEIIWRLGGKQSDFTMKPGTHFAYQHDARGLPGGFISLFDDGAFTAASAIEPVSRAIILQLDSQAMTAELAREEANPQGALSFAMGNTQLLADGGMFVGWGTTPECSEFDADGTLRFDATLPGGGFSYRAFRSPWNGTQTASPPALVATPNSDGSLQLFMSWNGATAISRWQILGGPSKSALRELRTVPHGGFETTVLLDKAEPYLVAVPLDRRSRPLATTHVVRT